MNRALLIQKLERLAKDIFPWSRGDSRSDVYLPEAADLRELLEEAAKQLKQPA